MSGALRWLLFVAKEHKAVLATAAASGVGLGYEAHKAHVKKELEAKKIAYREGNYHPDQVPDGHVHWSPSNSPPPLGELGRF